MLTLLLSGPQGPNCSHKYEQGTAKVDSWGGASLGRGEVLRQEAG